MAIKTFQVTMTGAAVQVSTQPIICNWFTYVNNAAAEIDLGDANLQPIHLAPGGTFYQNRPSPGVSNLQTWYAKGTNTQKLDVIYDDGTL